MLLGTGQNYKPKGVAASRPGGLGEFASSPASVTARLLALSQQSCLRLCRLPDASASSPRPGQATSQGIRWSSPGLGSTVLAVLTTTASTTGSTGRTESNAPLPQSRARLGQQAGPSARARPPNGYSLPPPIVWPIQASYSLTTEERSSSP